jgi:hypothetical protein
MPLTYAAFGIINQSLLLALWQGRRAVTIGSGAKNHRLASTPDGVRGANCPSAMLGIWGIEEAHPQPLISPLLMAAVEVWYAVVGLTERKL